MIEILGTVSHSGLKTHVSVTRSDAIFREYGNGRTYSGVKLVELFPISVSETLWVVNMIRCTMSTVSVMTFYQLSP
jgi:hypothetical protein